MRIDKETQERHHEEYQLWIKEITKSLALVLSGEWNKLDYQIHMIEIAKKIRLPYQDILEMKQKLKDLLEETK